MIRNEVTDGAAGDVMRSGIDWNIDGEGTLTVAGSGRMPDLRKPGLSEGNHADSLWQDIRDSIRSVQIGEGIREIGMRDFEDCPNLTRVQLPSSLTRIRAYAFRNCAALRVVEFGDRELRYVYEKAAGGRKDAEETSPGTENADPDDGALIFGPEAFSGTPWERAQFGDLYCRGGILYSCLSYKDSIAVPDGIRTIAALAFRNVHAKELVLPESLETIEKSAFAGACFDKIVMPGGGGDILAQPGGKELLDAIGEGSVVRREEKSIKIPYLYELAVKKTGYGSYKQFEIREKKAKVIDGEVQKLWGRKLVDVGNALYRKLMRGGILIGIRWNRENKIEDVRSFVWLDRHKCFDEYLMYPCKGKYGGIEAWRDSTTYQEKEDFLAGFGDMAAEELIKEGAIRYAQEDIREEWFWSAEKRDYAGPAELRLLEEWLGEHAGITVCTDEENREKDRYRIFVGV